MNDFEPNFTQNLSRAAVAIEGFPDHLALGDEMLDGLPRRLGRHIVIVLFERLGLESSHLVIHAG